METWNWLDWILAALVAASVATGIAQGFLRELISLASVVAGLVVGVMGYNRAALGFDDLTRSHEVAQAAGFLVLFLGTLAIGALVSLLARKLIKAAGLQWFDRFLGGVFGLARAVLVASILLMVMLAFTLKPEAVRASTLAPYVSTGARVIALAMPGSLKAQFQLGFEKFRQKLIERDKNPTRQ